MSNVLVVTVLLVCFSWTSATNLDWWKTATFYQIYPRSFLDSNNDGDGDLRGIAEKVEYFKDLGIDAIWLSPIYASPLKDGGYDISDYNNINQKYGSIQDLEYLKTQLQQNGIKLILDFVPNHTSDEHEWFTKSVDKDSDYEDYYIWVDSDSTNPPNNWLSVFGDGSQAWTYNENRSAWYLHQFYQFQPDLNYRSEKVQSAMKDVITYWLDMGVDGFRIDAVPYLYEVDDFSQNEPFNADLCPGNEDENQRNYTCYSHTFTKDQNETFEQIYTWREHVDNYVKDNNLDAVVLMTEAYTTIENTFKYYGDDGQLGAHFSFNFNLIQYVNNDTDANGFVKAINDDWLQKIPEGYISNWVLGNHDNHRVATRLANVLSANSLNMLTAVLPGIMVTYMGEELGMKDVYIPYDNRSDDCLDYDETLYPIFCRNFERTPFPWDNSTNCGFNDGDTDPWLQADCSINLEDQINQTGSSVEIYKQLIKLRKDDVLKDGTTDVRALDDQVFLVNRTLGNSSVILLMNTGDNTTDIELNIHGDYHVVMPSGSNIYKENADIDVSKITLVPHDGLLIRGINANASATLVISSVLLLLGILSHLSLLLSFV